LLSDAHAPDAFHNEIKFLHFWMAVKGVGAFGRKPPKPCAQDLAPGSFKKIRVGNVHEVGWPPNEVPRLDEEIRVYWFHNHSREFALCHCADALDFRRWGRNPSRQRKRPPTRKECNMQLSPYVNFNGQCEAAFKFYEQCLNGKIVSMTAYAGTPMAKQVPPEWHNKICHASLVAADNSLMGYDALPDRYDPPKGFYITIGIKDPLEAERLFGALAEGGTVGMPLQKTFWAVRFGMLVDQFGIPWMINCGEDA
jgi:PhnB protein